MILYLCNISQLEDMSGVDLLTSGRKADFESYKQHRDKLRSLAAGLLLRYLLKEKAELVQKGEHGKLYLPDKSVYFNISHSDEWVVLAADNGEVGVDVEKIAPVNNGVARRCYTDDELEWLARQDMTREFFTLWTGKESIMKATGRGFSMPPESFSLMPVKDGLHTVSGENWYLHWYQLEGYALCTASKSEKKGELVFPTRQELLGSLKTVEALRQ